MRAIGAAVLACLSLLTPSAGEATSCTNTGNLPGVRFETTLGDFVVELCQDDVPETVDNFITYVRDGAYTDTGYIHRSVDDPNVIQGGGFYIENGTFSSAVEQREPIDLELAGLSNTRGTLAMARTNDPNSATSQWYVNVQDNLGLDSGFAVFGEVTQGLNVVDQIRALQSWQINDQILTDVPLIGYPGDGSSQVPYLVYVTDVVLVPEPATGLLGMTAVAVVGWLARTRREGVASRS
jgi:cyclophilin family peptidyl-prolyl cis-trans isomerase